MIALAVSSVLSTAACAAPSFEARPAAAPVVAGVDAGGWITNGFASNHIPARAFGLLAAHETK